MTTDERKARKAEYMREYKKRNREKIAEQNRAWYEKNNTTQKEYHREYYAKKRGVPVGEIGRRPAAMTEDEARARRFESYVKYRNKPGIREYKREYFRKHAQEALSRSYVAQLLEISVENLTDELYELKRSQVMIRRCIDQLKTVIKEKRDER